MATLVKTDFNFPGQKSVYHGKVRDVYNINDDLMVMVATDRISAFDVILPKGIPYKGQVLNQIASTFLDATADIVPNWKLATPDPMVTVGLKCEGFRVEMIIRGYLTGSAWRDYQNGCRSLCGVSLPDGMRENQKFPEPIITPTTKADEGHDQNISKEEIIASMKKGVYITSLQGMHAGMNAQSGNYSLQAAGFYIEDGKIVKPVSLITVSGNLIEDFNKVIAVASDAKLTYQAIEAPSILIRALSISGK